MYTALQLGKLRLVMRQKLLGGKERPRRTGPWGWTSFLFLTALSTIPHTVLATSLESPLLTTQIPLESCVMPESPAHAASPSSPNPSGQPIVSSAFTASTQSPVISEFLSSDERISLWVRLMDVRVGDAITFRWYDPDGKLYYRHTLTRAEEAEASCSWSTLNLADMPAASRLGLWRVEIAFNNVVQLSEKIRISRSARILVPMLEQAPGYWLPSLHPLPGLAFVSTDGPVLVSIPFRDLAPGDVWELRWIDPSGRRLGPLSGHFDRVDEPESAPLNRTLRVFWPTREPALAENSQVSTSPSPDGLPPKSQPKVSDGLQPGDWTLEVWLNDVPRQSVHVQVLPDGPSVVQSSLSAYLGEGSGNPCSRRSLNPLVALRDLPDLDTNPLAERLLPRGSGLYREPTATEASAILKSVDAMLRGRASEAWLLAQQAGMVWTAVQDAQARQRFWVLEAESLANPRGFEALMVYSPAGDPGLIVEVPRPLADVRATATALALLRRGASILLMPGADVAANHRFQERLTEPLCALPAESFARNPDLDDSDAASSENSLFHQLHEGLLARHFGQAPPLVVQIQGFSPVPQPELSPDSTSCEADLVLAGSGATSDPDELVLEELAARLSRYPVHGERNATRYQVYYSGDEPEQSGEACAAMVSRLKDSRQVPSVLRAGGEWLSVSLSDRLRMLPVSTRAAELDARQLAESLWDTWRALKQDSGEPATERDAEATPLPPSPPPAPSAPVKSGPLKSGPANSGPVKSAPSNAGSAVPVRTTPR